MTNSTCVSGYPDWRIDGMTVAAIGKTFLHCNCSMELAIACISHPVIIVRMAAGSAFVTFVAGYTAGAAIIIIVISTPVAGSAIFNSINLNFRDMRIFADSIRPAIRVDWCRVVFSATTQ